MKLVETNLGIEINADKFIVLFGNKQANIENLKASYPDLKFKRIKQVHGSHIVSSSPHSIDFASEADAHFTLSAQLGLCITTADCAPVMLFCPSLKMVLAIHAGWRGIEKKIVPKCLDHLKRMPMELSPHRLGRKLL